MSAKHNTAVQLVQLMAAELELAERAIEQNATLLRLLRGITCSHTGLDAATAFEEGRKYLALLDNPPSDNLPSDTLSNLPPRS